MDSARAHAQSEGKWVELVAASRTAYVHVGGMSHTLAFPSRRWQARIHYAAQLY